mmetsp:Transcript_11245/g.37403  ORF Transcript_11245/g.37403 Transcript_11245/m.37403 type:complete len:212 (-) Transcript_11245:1813-2448(-)
MLRSRAARRVQPCRRRLLAISATTNMNCEPIPSEAGGSMSSLRSGGICIWSMDACDGTLVSTPWAASVRSRRIARRTIDASQRSRMWIRKGSDASWRSIRPRSSSASRWAASASRLSPAARCLRVADSTAASLPASALRYASSFAAWRAAMASRSARPSARIATDGCRSRDAAAASASASLLASRATAVPSASSCSDSSGHGSDAMEAVHR